MSGLMHQVVMRHGGRAPATPRRRRTSFRANTAPAGSAPNGLEKSQPKCGTVTIAANTDTAILGQLLCDTGVGSCPAGSNYPKTTGVVMQPLPKNLQSMPNPCTGVPNNASCVKGKPA
jgi:hypothetical protein